MKKEKPDAFTCYSDLKDAVPGRRAELHLYLFEPRTSRMKGVIRELKSRKIVPIPVDEDFFSDERGLPGMTGERLRPILLGDVDRIERQIADLRGRGCENPVIVYCDLRSRRRTAELLDVGADHVVHTPLKGVELRARISAVLRRRHGHCGGSVRIGSLDIPFGDRQASWKGQPLDLPVMQAEILRRLALNLDTPVPRDILYDMLYGLSERKPFMNVMDRYVHMIRRRILERSGEEWGHLVTLHGHGYMLSSFPGKARSDLQETFQESVCLLKNHEL